jgi:hypothetical protein
MTDIVKYDEQNDKRFAADYLNKVGRHKKKLPYEKQVSDNAEQVSEYLRLADLSSNSDIKELQTLLNTGIKMQPHVEGSPPDTLKVDGMYGKKTAEAVNYSKKNVSNEYTLSRAALGY